MATVNLMLWPRCFSEVAARRVVMRLVWLLRRPLNHPAADALMSVVGVEMMPLINIHLRLRPPLPHTRFPIYRLALPPPPQAPSATTEY